MAGPGQLDMFSPQPQQPYVPSAEERMRVAKENKVVDPDKLVYRGGEWYYNDGMSEVELSKWRQDGEELYTKDSDYWKN